MAKYKLSQDGKVIDTEVGRYGIHLGSRYWEEYQAWLAAGNVADPADPIVPPPTEQEQLETDLTGHPLFKRLIKMLAVRFTVIQGTTVTPRQIINQIKSRT